MVDVQLVGQLGDAGRWWMCSLLGSWEMLAGGGCAACYSNTGYHSDPCHQKQCGCLKGDIMWRVLPDVARLFIPATPETILCLIFRVFLQPKSEDV